MFKDDDVMLGVSSCADEKKLKERNIRESDCFKRYPAVSHEDEKRLLRG